MNRTAISLLALAGLALPAAILAQQDPWFNHAVFYEVYPRSFQDSNGDGLGDLKGIQDRLPYLQRLGVDAIWIAPMYPSPQVDFGYDISDYENVDPQYGTLADMDRLIAEGKRRNVKVVLDMVLNHTSDKHAWFLDSASSRTNPHADWYIWNDGIPAATPGITPYQMKYAQRGPSGEVVPPNNWVSTFGGSAWEWVPARKQFYYHYFYKAQPDLNWRNPAVEKACFDAMRFWLDRGVAGFRLDAIPTLFEDPQFREETLQGPGVNAQGDPFYATAYQENLPEVHDVIRRMRKMVDAYPGNRVLIGETYLPNTAELNKWYGGQAHDELNLPMDFLLGFHGDHDKLDATNFRARLLEADTQIYGSRPLYVFDNHDNVRSIDRYAPPGTTPAQKLDIARILATVLYTTRAAAMTWEGAEIGMVTTTPTRVEDVRDPIGITGWPKEKGRDGERTPMQWTPGKDAGFSTAPKTWLPIAPDYKTVNVEVEQNDPNSLLVFNEKLIALRRTNPALREGKFTVLDPTNPSVLSYARTAPDGRSVLIVLNFTSTPQTITLDPTLAGLTGKTIKTLLTSTPTLASTTTLTKITLPPYASWVATLQ